MKLLAMASIIALHREGHLAVAFQMFSFLKSKKNGVTVLGPADPEIDQNHFPTEDFSVIPYGTCKEDSLSNVPVSILTDFTMTAFVESDHASDSVTHYSRTGFNALLKSAPVFLCLKKEGICEASSFGSEFIPMKHCL